MYYHIPKHLSLRDIHDRKLLHRDVKPENILVNQDGTIALSDFGISIIAHSERSMSQRDMGGTAVYMAPEQFQGKPKPASDQYSLGIVVYEWLCGTTPFHGDIVQLAYQHSCSSPQPLHEKMVISPAIEHVIFKALAKEPQHRFPKVQEFACALERASRDNVTEPHYESGLSYLKTRPSNQSKIVMHPLQLPFVDYGKHSEQASTTEVPSSSTQFHSYQLPIEQSQAPADESMSSPIVNAPFYQPANIVPPSYSEIPYPKKKRRLHILTFSLVLAVILVFCTVFLGIGYSILHNFTQTGTTEGSGTAADNFMKNLKQQDYNSAFNELDNPILLSLTLNDFMQQAQAADDHCYGSVISYDTVANSLISQGANQSIAYMVSRSKLQKRYKFELRLNQDTYGNWLIVSYGSDLGPAPPPPSTCV